MPDMRVLYVINGLGTGGSERSLAELLPALRDGGVEPVIACLFHRHEGVHEALAARGFDVRVLPGPGWATRARALRRLVRATGPDLVHTAIFESDVLGRWAARRPSVPVLTNPPLARALHREVEVGQMIPDDFFAAVAEVLAFVYRTSRRRRAAA